VNERLSRQRKQRVVLYHRTTTGNVKAILAEGFRDRSDCYMTDRLWTGVWLSNVPSDQNEGAHGDSLLRVELQMNEATLDEYEWKEAGKGYREWLVPARLINPRMRVQLVHESREDALVERLFRLQRLRKQRN